MRKTLLGIRFIASGECQVGFDQDLKLHCIETPLLRCCGTGISVEAHRVRVSGTVLTGLNNQVAPSPWVPLPASQARSCSCPTCLTRGMSKISRAKKGFRRVSATGSHACERITSRLGTIASTIDQQDIHTRVRTIEAPLMYSLVWASSAATLTPKSDLYVAGSR